MDHNSGTQSLAERLEYSEDAKLLIIHADDLGLSNSENKASIECIENGMVNSASIMVPCPWFSQIAAYAREHKNSKDFGVHLTLTSEWTHYKWGPVSSLRNVPSLVDEYGFFHSSVDLLQKYAKPEEVVIELRNQVEKALKFGINITHLDAHMLAARSTPEFLAAYVKVGREYILPVLLSHDDEPLKSINLGEHDVVVDNLYQAEPADYDTGLINYYKNLIMNLRSGLSCLLVHPAFDDEETRAMTLGHTYWGSNWRQLDYNFFTSRECKQLIQENNIQLITWRELREKIVRGNSI